MMFKFFKVNILLYILKMKFKLIFFFFYNIVFDVYKDLLCFMKFLSL